MTHLMRYAVSAAFAAGLLLGCSSSERGGPDSGPADPQPPGTPDAGGAGGGPLDDCPITAPEPVVAVFTAGGAQPDLAIEDRLVHLVAAAEPNARLRAAFAYLDQQRMADALIDADRRGVDVRIVLDERNQVRVGDAWKWNGAVASLQAGLGPERVTICGGADSPPDGGGCIGSEKQHNAFLLVSDTCDGSTSVVAQTSAYPTKPQLFKRNNLVVVSGDDALFTAYDDYWRDLARDQGDATYYRIVDGDRGNRLFLYPRAPSGDRLRDQSTDTIDVLLAENVDCARKTRVRLAMAYWTAARDYLVDELARLAAAGCDVAVVANPDTTEDSVAGDLRAAFDADHLAWVAGVHHKYLLVDGTYAGAAGQLVWTGTQDFTASALRSNDEAILRLEGAAIHGRFSADWSAMFAAGQ
jgi:phosphatidylserine/phosphatidylglycerophosphate/cardiolipin synthase-like enzyme